MLSRIYSITKDKSVTSVKPQHGFFDCKKSHTTTKRFSVQQYQKSSHFMLLSDFDQTSLKNHLFTGLGQYALMKNYIDVDQFLTLNVSARETLSRLLAPQEKNRLRSETIIDRIFKNGHLNLSDDMFNNLKSDKREMLIRLYALPKEIGLCMIENGHININDYLDLSLEEQQTVLGTLAEAADTYHLECQAVKVDSRIAAIFAEKVKASISL